MTIWFLASEFLPNGSLRDRIARTQGPLSLDMVRQAGLDIAQAAPGLGRAADPASQCEPELHPVRRRRPGEARGLHPLRGEVMETLYDITRGRLDMGEYQYQAPEVLQGRET